jgi:YVTN family beta-propeller protein
LYKFKPSAILYDQQRKRLYATNQDHNRVEIFDLINQKYLIPISVGNQPRALTLTPDAARLAIVNSADKTISVIDPNTAQVIATYPVLTSADVTCGGLPLNISPVEPHRVLLNLACTNTFRRSEFPSRESRHR